MHKSFYLAVYNIAPALLPLQIIILGMRILFLASVLCCISIATHAQEKWNLKTIVDYAMANNLGVRQSEVQAKLSAITLYQSKQGRYPSLQFNANSGLSSGSNQDPTTFSRITQTYLSNGMQLQSSAEIFNFYSRRNAIAANEWELKAAMASVSKNKNDIALLAANMYLQILLSKEQEKITAVQIEQTTAQLANTKKQVDAGALPELNLVQLQAQLAQDSVNYINARGNTIQSILTLKSYMNMDAATPFDVEVPPVETIPLEPIADLQPEYVYNQAIHNQPQQLVNEYRIKAAEKSAASAKGAMYPSLSAYGSLGSNFLVSKFPRYAQVPTGNFYSTGAIVSVNNVNYSVQAPEFALQRNGNTKSGPVFTQLSDNFRQSVGLSISVPIFNGATLRSNYEKAKLNLSNLELQKQADNQKLKQDIYSAYNAAMVALEKFNASQKAVTSSQQTFDFATKRYQVGMLGTFDLITTQNNLLRAKLEYTLNRFDYVFKMKVLEFYKGLGLKL